MDKLGLSLIGLLIVCVIAYCTVRGDVDAAPSTGDQQSHVEKEKRELMIASAYACGMLDALQEKRHRAQACDDYRAIAKARGVNVPP